MNLIVQKYGGSSLENGIKMEAVAKKILSKTQEGYKVIVVVSAMGKTTQNLLDMTKSIVEKPSPRELDMLLTTGEQISASLLAMVISEKGITCRALNAFQLGIKTDHTHTEARIQSIDRQALLSWLEKYDVLVITGFQGVTEEGDLTTLGRGGSDTTAVALAAVLQAPCEIYSDVSGIYTVDPKVYPNAKKLLKIRYDEMLEMARHGSKVLHDRSVEIAQRFQIPIYCASSFSDEPGSLVVEETNQDDAPVVTGLSILNHQVLITAEMNRDESLLFSLTDHLKENKLNIDMIAWIRNVDKTFLSLSVWEKPGLPIRKELDQIADHYADNHLQWHNDYTKITLVGAKMRNTTGVAASIFQVIPVQDIHMVTTSEISVSLLTPTYASLKMIQKVAGEFSL